ncbi:MAG: hypothetical protein AAGB11_01665 [Pseudomonadota bacterium]
MSTDVEAPPERAGTSEDRPSSAPSAMEPLAQMSEPVIRIRGFGPNSPITSHVLADADDIVVLAQRRTGSVQGRARLRQLRRWRRLYPRAARAIPLGVVVVIFYLALFTNQRVVLEASVGSSWSFVVPVSIALVFSLVHGAFTGAFWDACGLRGNTRR